ncbi:unnamed protein product [Urochloa humidicola]
MKVQSECLEWKNGCFNLTEKHNRMETQITTLQEAHTSLQASHKNLMEDHEKALKKLENADTRVHEALQAAKLHGENYQRVKAEYDNLQEAATLVVNSIKSGAEEESLPPVDRLRAMPTKIAGYVNRTCCYVANKVLAVVRSFYPDAELEDALDGRADNCSKEDFEKYMREYKPVAEQVIAKLNLG